MNLAEIFVKLSPDVATALEGNIEEAAISSTPSKAELLKTCVGIVNETRRNIPRDISEAENELLEQVPEAISEVFGY